MKRKYILLSAAGLLCLLSLSPPVYANTALIARGVSKVVGSILAIPQGILSHSSRIIFPVGIVTGTLDGAVNMLAGTLSGAIDIAAGAAPYAKYMVFFI